MDHHRVAQLQANVHSQLETVSAQRPVSYPNPLSLTVTIPARYIAL